MPGAVSQSVMGLWADDRRPHVQAAGRIETDLQARVGLPPTWYEVLDQLAEAPGKKLRLRDLSDNLQISRSGVTRLVDRIEGAGFLVREPDGQDRRGVWAVLTRAGRGAITRAASTYANGIDRNQLLELTEMASWGAAWDRLVIQHDQPPSAPGAHQLIVGLVLYSQETADALAISSAAPAKFNSRGPVSS